MAQGRASYSVDHAGQHTTTHAAVNGLDPVKVGTMAQHQNIVMASNSLGSSKNWQLTMDTTKRASLSDSEAHGFASRLENAERESWRRAITDQSSFVHAMSENVRTQFSATISAGGIPILRKIGPQSQLLVTGQNGDQVSFNISEDTARNFENAASQVRTESLQQTLQDSKSLDYMTKLAKQIGATEAYSLLNNARDLRTATESHGADLTTALVKEYTLEHYGNESPKNIRRTIADFNSLLTRQGSEGVKKMEALIGAFISGNGYGQGDIANSVAETIAGIRGRVQHQEFKHDVGMSTNDAGAATFNIRRENFSNPRTDGELDNPNGDTVTNPADDIHRRNLQEESGKGRIHTDAFELAKDIAGLNKDKPLRPTDEYYRNQNFYFEGNLVQPQKQEEGIVLPSGTVVYGDANYIPPKDDEEFLKGSVFEKK